MVDDQGELFDSGLPKQQGLPLSGGESPPAAALTPQAAEPPATPLDAPQVFEQATKRLNQLAAYLGDSDWLEGEFTAGDLMMVSVLRVFDGTPALAPHPTLTAYVDRGQARPAFQRALAAQLADFRKTPALS